MASVFPLWPTENFYLLLQINYFKSCPHSQATGPWSYPSFRCIKEITFQSFQVRSGDWIIVKCSLTSHWTHSILQSPALLSSTAASTRFLSHTKAHCRPIRALLVLMLSLLPFPPSPSTFFRKSQFTSSTCLNDNKKPNSSLLLQSSWEHYNSQGHLS